MKGYFFLIFFREWLWKLQTIRVGYCIGFVLYSVAEGFKQLCHYTIYSLWIIGGAIWHVTCKLFLDCGSLHGTSSCQIMFQILVKNETTCRTQSKIWQQLQQLATMERFITTTQQRFWFVIFFHEIQNDLSSEGPYDMNHIKHSKDQSLWNTYHHFHLFWLSFHLCYYRLNDLEVAWKSFLCINYKLRPNYLFILLNSILCMEVLF